MMNLPQHLKLTNTHSMTIPSSSSNPYLIDQLHFMQTQESSLYQITHDYLASTTAKIAVSPLDRRTMCSWSYDIVDACSIDREVAIIGISYFDRFMATSSAPGPRSAAATSALQSRRQFQLSFIACLIIALKCRAGMQVDSDFVSDTICQGMYDPAEIVGMEKEILSALSWRMNGPSPHEFIAGMLELMPGGGGGGVGETLRALACVQVETAMVDYGMAFRTCSSVAFAALTAAMNTIDAAVFHHRDRFTWLKNIQMVMGLSVQDQLFELTCPVSTPAAKTPIVKDDDCSSHIMRTSTDHHEVRYCSPVSASEENLYCDVLSMTGSKESSIDLSAVCVLLNGLYD